MRPMLCSATPPPLFDDRSDRFILAPIRTGFGSSYNSVLLVVQLAQNYRILLVECRSCATNSSELCDEATADSVGPMVGGSVGP